MTLVNNHMLTRKQAKRLLKSRGWSYRAAAPVLGVHHVHLALVLTETKNHQRESRRLLAKIATLPTRAEWVRKQEEQAGVRHEGTPEKRQ